jgi:hypothetical protein
MMAYIESAVVVYLRAMYGIEDLLRDIPLLTDLYTAIEIGREAVTLIILVVIGWIAGRRWQDRVGYSLFAFGLWDIFYYIWLVIFIGWPRSLLDWDLLFLIPLPWWGPVLSPLLIAVMMAIGGGIAVLKAEREQKLRFTLIDLIVIAFSTLLALYVFMKDALHALPGGIEALSRVRPSGFSWPLFLISLTGMALFLLRISRSKGKAKDTGICPRERKVKEPGCRPDPGGYSRPPNER